MFCCVPQAHRGWNRNGSIRLCEAVEEMTVGPSKSVVRNRLQTTPSGCIKSVGRERWGKVEHDSTGMNQKDERK